MSGHPGTKKECLYIIPVASHFMVKGLFQLEESRDLPPHSASFSSHFLAQASSVSSFQILGAVQVSSGFAPTSHAHPSKSGSWRACATWFGSMPCSGDLQPSSRALILPETCCPSLRLSDPPFSSENSPALLESETPSSPSGKHETLLLLL